MPKKTPTKPSSPAPATKSLDWSHWENLSTVSLREALQLSLGLDPHSHIPALEADQSLRELYWNRLMVCRNHAPEADWVVGRVVREDGDISVEFTEVYLKKFAAWIINETTLRPLPDEFERWVSSEVKGGSTQPKQSKQYWTKRPAEEFIQERNKLGSLTAAAALHGVSRQRYAEVHHKVTGRSAVKRKP